MSVDAVTTTMFVVLENSRASLAILQKLNATEADRTFMSLPHHSHSRS